MKKVALFIVFAIVLSMAFSVGISALAYDVGDWCIDHTPTLVDNTYRYLDEIYIEKYPEMGLRWLYGNEEDKAVMQTLSDTITKSCTTDREKADAVAHWIKNNITYVKDFSAYPTDTFYFRSGNCMSYAILMQTLLRLQGITAVAGEGFEGNMENTMVYQLLDAPEGHAWCYAYIDGEWLLYDPLWNNYGVTDRDFICKWFFPQLIEGVFPVYSEEIPPARFEDCMVCYIDGRFMALVGGAPASTTSHTMCINNLPYHFSIYQPNGGFYYVDNPEGTDDMFEGCVLTDGHITYSDSMYFYAYETGAQATATIMEIDGKKYFFNQGQRMSFYAEEGEYFFLNGTIAVEPGYEGKIFWPEHYEKLLNDPKYEITVKVDNPSVASVDIYGNVKCFKEGYIEVVIESRRQNEDGVVMMGMQSLTFICVEDGRVADYTDRANPTPEGTPETTPNTTPESTPEGKPNTTPSDNNTPTPTPSIGNTDKKPLPPAVTVAAVTAGTAAVGGGAVAVANKLGWLKLFKFLKK